MKKQSMFIVAGAVLAGVIAGRYAFPAGSTSPGSTVADHLHDDDVASAQPEIWTCSMHPQIQQPTPGDCPICGMDLIPLVQDTGEDLGPRSLAISESAGASPTFRPQRSNADCPR
ncbi:MAG: hypothetical protein J6386_01100 [Candidatus Synoicihabitans palmerolidicus]|nr:hypothetical protein [Candidatus Synoicihabitans palmerolidicus]